MIKKIQPQLDSFDESRKRSFEDFYNYAMKVIEEDQRKAKEEILRYENERNRIK